ncbi:MAG: tRNA (adenosine(37)-N6)-dimethylallyltransferase MiaA [Verrucomicrobia bacterium]|nr:tRNA (adenosine(37)-N6)-dimethylallyltransferase MiaA [Verrucomicrobiota bacterium]MCH8513044.1 tRNA (adenosine(37)-N6)-dimethylallyltransferase MiaA [Kiritimatiellia bacterium]
MTDKRKITASVTSLYFLSGPTASGKTELAHALAARSGYRLCSADSMMVYRHMNIGTAKPTSDEIAQYDYAGLNGVEPGAQYSTGAWIKDLRQQLDDRPTLVVGGTGLYFRALIHGLPEEDEPTTLTEENPAILREKIREIDPEALQNIADPENPRRLERALAWLQAGKPLPKHWQNQSDFPIPVLSVPVPELNQRIHDRAADMFAHGLLDEARALRARFGQLTGTCAQAIGYKEAFAVLDGDLNVTEAVEAVAQRTRRYAKRQRTWFRNQMDARWVTRTNGTPLEDAIREVEKIWKHTGPFPFHRSPS